MDDAKPGVGARMIKSVETELGRKLTESQREAVAEDAEANERAACGHDRALGQWWARYRENGRPLEPVLVRGWDPLVDHAFEAGIQLCVWQGHPRATRADDPDIEWGDYIGTGPEDARKNGEAYASAAPGGEGYLPGWKAGFGEGWERGRVEGLREGTKEAARAKEHMGRRERALPAVTSEGAVIDGWEQSMRNSPQRRAALGVTDDWDIVPWQTLRVGDVVRTPFRDDAAPWPLVGTWLEGEVDLVMVPGRSIGLVHEDRRTTIDPTFDATWLLRQTLRPKIETANSRCEEIDPAEEALESADSDAELVELLEQTAHQLDLAIRRREGD